MLKAFDFMFINFRAFRTHRTMTLTAATSSALRRYAATTLVKTQTRGFAVVNLSDGSAVDKFRTINSKSVLYFTAT